MLLPDPAENPVYNAVVTAPRCAVLGFTTYTNPETGYTYTDDYTAPAHTPDRWEVITPATYESEGLRRQSCAECGVLLREETTPRLVSSTSCTLNESNVRLPYGETLQLTATVLPEDTTDKNLQWMSSDETVLRVDGGGLVTAVGKGTAAIYVKTGDGFSSAACEIEVYLTAGQWITRYILFGWLWEK